MKHTPNPIALIILGLLTIVGIAALQRITITEYTTKSGAVCFGDPSPFDCEFPPTTPVIMPPFTPVPSATPTRPPPPSASPTTTALPPLLINGDFEQANHAAWTFFNLWTDTPLINDERGDPRSRFDGLQSFRMWNNFRCVMAGLYQSLPVDRFTTLEFSAWGRTWASEGVFPEGHDPNVYDGIAVGIDPNGGTSPSSSGVIWVENFDSDEGVRVTVRATALSNRVTVFIRARVGVVDPNGTACQWPHTHMMGFIDGATLTVVP